jgi:hypothetical protein
VSGSSFDTPTDTVQGGNGNGNGTDTVTVIELNRVELELLESILRDLFVLQGRRVDAATNAGDREFLLEGQRLLLCLLAKVMRA